MLQSLKPNNLRSRSYVFTRWKEEACRFFRKRKISQSKERKFESFAKKISPLPFFRLVGNAINHVPPSSVHGNFFFSRNPFFFKNSLKIYHLDNNKRSLSVEEEISSTTIIVGILRCVRRSITVDRDFSSPGMEEGRGGKKCAISVYSG